MCCRTSALGHNSISRRNRDEGGRVCRDFDSELELVAGPGPVAHDSAAHRVDAAAGVGQAADEAGLDGEAGEAGGGRGDVRADAGERAVEPGADVAEHDVVA